MGRGSAARRDPGRGSVCITFFVLGVLFLPLFFFCPLFFFLPFTASAALSATVGLGNIAGVAVAVGVGGPGAIFWMVLAGLLGMSSKFAECSLGQKFRLIDDRG